MQTDIASDFSHKPAQGPSFNDVGDQKMLHKYQTKEEKATFLAQETGMELILAEEFLSSNGWNLSEAFKGYNELLELEKKRKANKTSSAGNKNLKEIGRGFSAANSQLVQDAREKLADEGTLENKLALAARRSFVLPDVSQNEKALAAFIREDLISQTTLTSLSGKGRLNWWADIGACRELFPLSTIGDGNCLLHAASLGMWGFHDRMLQLRKALHLMLLDPIAKESIKRRWKYNAWKDNMKSGNLTYTRAEWDQEWNEVVKLASERPHHYETGRQPRRMSRALIVGGNGDTLREGESLDSLEAIHVYVLSNLIRRPIIVIAEDMLKDSHGRDIAPIPFGGIYLPLEQAPERCWKYPLVLSYECSHFSALVPVDGDAIHKGEQLSTSVPLVDSSLALLPIRFVIDPGSTWDLLQDSSKEESTESTEENRALLRNYLDVKASFNTGGVSPKKYLNKMMNHVHDMFAGESHNVLIAAKLNMKDRPDNYKGMIENYLENARQRLQLKVSKTKCLTPNCNMFSSPELNGYCLVCHDNKRLCTPKAGIGGNVSPGTRHRGNTAEPPRNQTKLPTCPPPPYDGTGLHSVDPGRTNMTSSVTRVVGTTCQSPGCKFYGSLETKGYCSSCYRKITK